MLREILAVNVSRFDVLYQQDPTVTPGQPRGIQVVWRLDLSPP